MSSLSLSRVQTLHKQGNELKKCKIAQGSHFNKIRVINLTNSAHVYQI